MTELAEALEALARAPRLLVALDFDGTVAPLQDDPMQSRALPGIAATLKRLRAMPRTWTAYVSGRPLEHLRLLTDGGPDALLIGSHGAELQLGADDDGLTVSVDERRRMDALGERLRAIVQTVPGAWVEDKPIGFAVHTRLADQALAPGLQRQAREAAAEVGGFLERTGKNIVEFATRTVTKGYGIERMRNELAEPLGDRQGRALSRDAVTVLYAGDDVTDEDAFAVLRPGDLGIKVGPGETLAAYRVASPEELGEALALLAERREASSTRA